MVLLPVSLLIIACCVSRTFGGISPIHDLKEKYVSKNNGFILSSPHNVLKHLDDSILRNTKNVTQNPQMEENLYQISKDIVSAILSKLETQDKITKITREALEAPGNNKGITAIETRRILDYISRTLSGNILSITRASTEPELHRLVYGLAQIAAEISIVSALKDTTYATALSKKQSVDLSLRKKRSIPPSSDNVIASTPFSLERPIFTTSVYKAILSKKDVLFNRDNTTLITNNKKDTNLYFNSPFSVISRNDKKPMHFVNNVHSDSTPLKGFLNQTALDIENQRRESNNTDGIILENSINSTHYVRDDPIDTQKLAAPGLTDDWMDTKENIYKPLNPDVVADIEIDQPDVDDDPVSEKRNKQKLEKLETKAKKAILYAGDVAYLTAASVVALRRALTASIEVKMSVKYAKNGMSNHQDLMMNLAKTAAQQAGKEARSASSKSLACERVIKLALKYAAQSHGANLNHVANRILMDTLSLATLAKSMAFVSSDIAINSLYQATDVRPPS